MICVSDMTLQLHRQNSQENRFDDLIKTQKKCMQTRKNDKNGRMKRDQYICVVLYSVHSECGMTCNAQILSHIQTHLH